MKRTLALFSLVALIAMALAACGAATTTPGAATAVSGAGTAVATNVGAPVASAVAGAGTAVATNVGAPVATTVAGAGTAVATNVGAPVASTVAGAGTAVATHVGAPVATTVAGAGTAVATAAAGATTMMPIKDTVTLWHAYGTGSTEEATLNKLIEKARAAYPDAKINVLQIPFDQIFNKFQNEVTSGAGPDMFIAPNDSLGDQIRQGLLADLSEYVPALKAESVSPKAIEGMSLDGKLYAIPESFKTVALYYNKSKVATPPTTLDELLALVKGGKTLVLNQEAYYNFGWLQSFGGKLMDASGKCVADTTGGVEWLTFLKTLKAQPTVTFSTEGSKQNSLFQEGKADMTISGPWTLGDYRKALGDKLAVAPMPGGANVAGPLTGVDGFYVNVNSTNIPGAVALAMFLTSADSMKLYVDDAGHVPARTDVAIADANVKGFAEAAKNGVPRPQVAELANFWGNFNAAITQVVDGGIEPSKAITTACTQMNTANKK